MAPSPSILYTVIMLTVITRGTSSLDQSTALENFRTSSSSSLLPEKDTPTTKMPSSNETYGDDSQNYLVPMDGVNKTVHIYNGVQLDINDIFRVPSNDGMTSNKTIVECTNSSVANHMNLMVKCNHSLAVEAVDELTVLGTVDMVAVAAGICLVSAVIGYFSCVGYRRYLQRKYGNNEMIAQEDAYDTTDLRYFEI